MLKFSRVHVFQLLLLLIIPVGEIYAQVVVEYNDNSTFTVPAGVRQVTVQVWGAGGGGGSGADGRGGGGGGGYAQAVINVTEGNSFSVTVGAGGGVGAAGGNSLFTNTNFTVQANGGGSTNNTAGGAGGGSSFSGSFISTANFTGGNGGVGGTGGNRGGGGGGGSATANANGGIGGNGTNTTGGAGGIGEGNGGVGGRQSVAGNGLAPGGGGGGRGAQGGPSGSGASGRIIVTYQQVSAANSTVSVNTSSVLANGISASTLTVQVRDTNNTPITNLTAGDFVFSGIGAANIASFTNTGSGVYTFLVTNTTVQSVNIGVEVWGINLGNTGTISFTLPVPVAGNSSVQAVPTTIAADGTASSTITLTVRDADNIAIANLASGDFSFSGQGSASITNFSNNGGGSYTYSVTNAVAQTINITFSARSATIGSSGNISFILAKTLYSFKSGPWNDPQTWTEDPSGTTAVNQAVPGDGDFVTILVGRTVTLSANVSTNDLNIFIEEGGILNLDNFTLSPLNTLEGGGRLRSRNIVTGTPNVAYFPTVANNPFIGPNGGTVEYFQQGNITLPTNITTYRNLRLTNATTSSYTYTQSSNIELFGNLTLNNTSSGNITLQLGNNTTARSMIVGGNVTLSANSTWEVGNFNTNHSVQIGGNLVNNGQFIMTRRAQPAGWPNANPGYGTAPSEGRADVTFTGAQNNRIDAFGLTRFYRLVVDKGIDQTDVLTVNSTNVNNFQLFGQNNQTIDQLENPESNKALFIRNGTLRLKDNILIPSLSEGGRDFVINKNAALWIDGATVFATLNGTGNAGVTVIGKLRVSGNANFDTRNSAGLIFQRDAEIIIEGGTLRMSQFRPSGSAGDHRAAFIMSGGLLITDGVGEDGNADGRFSLRFEENSFTMSGGEIRVSAPRGTGFGNGIDIRVSAINQNVTGGTWRVIVPTGTNNFRINSTAPFYNLIVEKQGTGAADARLDADLIVLNDVTVESGTFQVTSDFNLSVGGNFDIRSGAAFTPNNNTTTFNGSGPQVLTVNGTLGSGGFFNFQVNKSADTLRIAGSAATINVRNDLSLTSGNFNDGGKTVEVAGNVINSALHLGSGKIVLNPNGNRTISGDGNGIFGNLELSGPASNVVFTASSNFRINGALTFVANGNNQRMLDIGSRLLRFGAESSIAGFNEFRYIRTDGNASAGGISKDFGTSLAFTWPVGVPSKYTPASITLSQAPEQSGSINLKPVNSTHPAIDNPARALNYYWSVVATGFDLGSAQVTKTFEYLDSDLGATIAASDDDLAPSLYQFNSNQWSTGQASAVNTTTKTITFSGALYQNTLSGDHTAGDVTEPEPFIELEVFYSRTSGDWFSPTTWSTVGHTGAADVAVPPSAGAIVIIGSNHVVTVDDDGALAAYLSILEDATLDLAATTGHNFGTFQGPTYGTLRIGTNVFPAGDFLEFLQNGTTVYYRNGNDFTIPDSSPSISELNTYFNLVIDATGDTQFGVVTMPDIAIQVLNDFVIQGNDNLDRVRYGNGAATALTVEGNMLVQSGSFRYRFGGANNLAVEVKGNVEIAAGAELGFVDNTTNLVHSLIVWGNLVNDGQLQLQNNLNRHIRLIFKGNQTRSFSGSGEVTYTRIEIDKGSSVGTKLIYSNTGPRTAADNAYVLTNGTLEFARPGTFVVSNTNSEFTIASTTGITVNHENAIVRIGYANNNSADLVLRGRLEIKDGLVEIGNAANNTNNDIVYAAAGTPELFISGGILDVNGQIRRSTANVAGALNYRQSGSSITRIRGRNATTSRGMLEITNAGSFFELKDDATIQIYRGGSVTYADFYVRPTSFSVSGGTVLFSPTGVGSNQNYILDVSTALFNVIVQNDGSNIATLNQQINNLEILNNLTIKSEAVYNSSNLNIFIGGRFTRETDATFIPGNNTVTFTGNASQISGNFTSDSFFNLTIAANASLTQLSASPIRVRGNLTIESGGTLDDGDNFISLLGNLTSNGTHISFENNSTSGIEFIGTTTQTISGTGVYGNLNVNTTSLVTMAGDIEIINRLTLTANSLNLTDKRLTLGLNAEVTNFSASRYLRTNGVLSDGGIRKRFPSGVASFEFPIGVFGKYTPATIDISASTASGTITIKPINVRHPSNRLDGTNLLNYYWNVSTTGFNGETGLEASHVYQYLQADVAGDESIYVGARYVFPSWNPLLGVAGAVDVSTNRIQLDDVDYISGDFTAGESDEFDIVSTYFSRDVACDAPAGCNWDDFDAVAEVYTAWSTVGHDGAPATSFPDGEPVIIKTGHRVIANGNTRRSESLQLNGTAEIDLEDYFSHNFGVVTGTGTIRIKATSNNQYIFPGGNYDGFVAADSGNVVFYGDVAGVLPTQTIYNNVLMIDNSDRVQANVNWTINGNIEFDNGTVDNSEFNRNISLKGDWENNASADMYMPGTGKLIFFGSGSQAIKGDFPTNFGFVELNGSGSRNLQQDMIVERGMIFNSSNIYLNDFNMMWRSGATVSGTPSNSSMVVINGDGVLKREISENGALTFPVGDTTQTADFSPATLTFSSGVYGSGAFVQMGVTNQADPECGGGNFIRRFWTVEMTGITNFTGNGTFRYVNGDVVGDESKIRALSRDINSTNCVIGDLANTTTNELTIALSSSGFIITGGDKGALLPPGVQPSDIQFISVSAESIEIGWTNGDGTGRLVLAKEGIAVDGVPDVNEFYTADSDFSGNPQEIGSDNFVVFSGTGDNVTVTGLNPKTRYHFSLFEYNDDGSFITYLTTSPLVGDTLTMARFEITFTQDRGWRMIALPLTNTQYNDVFVDYIAPDSTGLVTQGFPNSTFPSASPNLLWYEEAFQGTDNQRWRQPGDISDAVVPGRGYMYYVFGLVDTDDRYSVDMPISLAVEGYEPALQGDFDFSVTYTETGDQGWNIIGNPYDDALDWDSSEWTKVNVADAIYIWDPNASGGPKYRVWSNSTGDILDGVIARGQAFWVRATADNPQLSVNRDAIVNGGTFYGKEQATEGNSGANRSRQVPPSIEISVSKDGLSQSTWLTFLEDANRGIDNKDAWHLQPLTDTYVSIYTKADNEQLAINALPRRFNTVLEVPIYIGGFSGGVSMSGNYTLEMGDFNNIPESWAIEMVDTKTGQRVFWKYANDPVLYRSSGISGGIYTDIENRGIIALENEAIDLANGHDRRNGSNVNGIQSNSRLEALAAQLADNELLFGLSYEEEMRIQTPRPGESIRMKAITGTSKSRFILRIHPNGEFNDLPEQITLWQNYPNPFNPSTTIKFGLPLEEQVQVDVFDVLGRRVATLASGVYGAGIHTVQFDGRRYASGVYFVRMVAGGKVETRKMLLIK